jgi:hypothetical protein
MYSWKKGVQWSCFRNYDKVHSVHPDRVVAGFRVGGGMLEEYDQEFVSKIFGGSGGCVMSRSKRTGRAITVGCRDECAKY